MNFRFRLETKMARGGGRRRGGGRDRTKKKQSAHNSRNQYKTKKGRGNADRIGNRKPQFRESGSDNRRDKHEASSRGKPPRAFHQRPKPPLVMSDSESDVELSAYDLLVSSVGSKPKAVKEWLESGSEVDSDSDDTTNHQEQEDTDPDSDGESAKLSAEDDIDDGAKDSDEDSIMDATDDQHQNINESAAEESDEEENAADNNQTDPFSHFEQDLEEAIVQKLPQRENWQTRQAQWPMLGRVIVQGVDPNVPPLQTTTKVVSASGLSLKQKLFNNIESVNKTTVDEFQTSEGLLTPLQQEVYRTISDYHDLYYSERTYKNGEELRVTYCLHALNHILKTRSKIVHHNAKMSQKDDVPDEYRDQGLTRPKVLIIVPFRESALRIVKLMMGLISSEEKTNVINKKRFQNEYSSAVRAPVMKARQRPDDYEATFAGNTDDMFRIGLAITKKSLKLFADFYTADIIIASPLGLRTVIGAEGEKERDYDFLSSIEILIMDQADVFMMQNWEHIMHVFNHLHLQPQESHGTDFSRVRMWSLNGWAKYYRQTIIFSGVPHPVINAVFNKQCWNYAGKVRVAKSVGKGTICSIVTQLPQVFRSFSSASGAQLPNARFQFFVNKILPQFKESVMARTLIYIPSYFDFVRLRNYFKKEELSFVQICEYTKDGKVARARDYFFHAKRRFLLCTERAHFFHRYVIKGIRHIIFYELPTYPHFYSEICNMLQESRLKLGENSYLTCTTLYAAQDAVQLAGVIGTDRANVMMNSDRTAHMFVTGEV